ncbi:hypothetical protein [Vulcanococcus limneticus]|uniref:hypothetical protein n=1 Tax=Vulcanococcus limneticus TaxID=2170428 RepID=UPI00398C0EEB
MEQEFTVLKFPNTAAGQAEKVRALAEAASKGWGLVSEVVTPDSYDADSAILNSAALCCVCGPVCAPFGALGKKKSGTISVTFSRSAEAKAKADSEAKAASERAAVEAKALREKLREEEAADREMANLLRVVQQFREVRPEERLSPLLLKAVDDYLKNHRRLGGVIPDLSRCTREGGGIVLRDSKGYQLRVYPPHKLRRLPEVDLAGVDGL